MKTPKIIKIFVDFIRYNYRALRSLIVREQLLANAAHKNSCEGDVYILFTGSSLKGKDLSWLSGKNVIATNMFFLNDYYSALDIQHYLLIEPWEYRKQWFLSWMLELIMLRKKINSKPTIWLHGTAKPYVDINEFHFDVNTSNLLDENSFRYIIGKGKFYEDGSVQNDFSTVVNTNVGTMTCALFFASFLGYKRIYLLGSDYTKDPRLIGHFYDNVSIKVHGFDDSLGLTKQSCDFTVSINKEAISHLKTMGVEILNVVDKGYISREFDSVGYESLANDIEFNI